MTTITKQYILDTLTKEWVRAHKIYKDLGLVKACNLKTVSVEEIKALGMADTKDGHIAITSHYIGTKMFDCLLDTIRHEICHILVGPGQGHNSVWQEACKIIGCNPKAKSAIKFDEVFLQNAYKYKVVAVNTKGEEITVAGRQKRAAKYLCYTPYSHLKKGFGLIAYYKYVNLETGEEEHSQDPATQSPLHNSRQMPTKTEYLLKCYLSSGEEVTIGRRRQRRKQLLNANPGDYLVRGEPVERFFYEKIA